MDPQRILDDLRADGIVPRLTPDGRGIELPAGRLNPAQRAAITANRPALLAHLLAQAGRASPPPPAPMPWLSVHQPWRTADRLYEAHHWQCPVCCAAARCRYTERCVEGQRLHDAYTLASSAALNESNP